MGKLFLPNDLVIFPQMLNVYYIIYLITQIWLFFPGSIQLFGHVITLILVNFGYF